MPADGGLAGNLRYIHRTLEDGTELYFVANKREARSPARAASAYRASGPSSGGRKAASVQLAAAWQEKDGVTRVPLYLEAAESVFVVFRPEKGKLRPGRGHDASTASRSRPRLPVRGEDRRGEGRLRRARRCRADPRRKTAVQKLLDDGGTVFRVAKLAAGDDPAFGIVKTLTVEYTVDGKPHKASGQDPDTICLCPRDRRREASGHAHGRCRRQRAAGSLAERPLRVHHGVRPQARRHRPGPSARPDRGGAVASEVPGRLRGAPERSPSTSSSPGISMPDDAVKYFSGTATYAKVITIPAELLGKDRGLYLDLGRVAVMARVKLNGKDLGVLWKAPYRVEIGQFAKPGENRWRSRSRISGSTA